MDCVIGMRDAMQSVYGALDFLPEPSGTLQRFHVPGDKSGSLNGWAVLYADGIASGAFGSWKHGQAHRWSSREPATPFEADQLRQVTRRGQWRALGQGDLRWFGFKAYRAQLWGERFLSRRFGGV